MMIAIIDMFRDKNNCLNDDEVIF